MDTRKIQCREHGGYFEIPLKRGRPPVKCSPGNQCDAHRPNPKATAKRVAGTLAGEMPRKATVRVVNEKTARGTAPITTEERKRTSEAIRGVRRAVGRDNTKQATMNKAEAAKAQLEALGWTVAGKGYTDPEAGFKAHLTATRGEELLVMNFVHGMISSSDYSLWAVDKPSKNNKPANKLTFDTDEIPDKELVEILKGNKATWWNRLGGREESAIISPDKIVIEHIFNGKGDEVPGERIVKFAEHGGSGFRAFRLDALIKVG